MGGGREEGKSASANSGDCVYHCGLFTTVTTVKMHFDLDRADVLGVSCVLEIKVRARGRPANSRDCVRSFVRGR